MNVRGTTIQLSGRGASIAMLGIVGGVLGLLAVLFVFIFGFMTGWGIDSRATALGLLALAGLGAIIAMSAAISLVRYPVGGLAMLSLGTALHVATFLVVDDWWPFAFMGGMFLLAALVLAVVARLRRQT